MLRREPIHLPANRLCEGVAPGRVLAQKRLGHGWLIVKGATLRVGQPSMRADRPVKKLLQDYLERT